MATVGDRVHVASRKLGQPPREGVVTGVSGALLQIKWSTGEVSTIVPGPGSVTVGGKARSGSRTAKAPARPASPVSRPARKAPAKSAPAAKRTTKVAKVAKASKTPAKRTPAKAQVKKAPATKAVKATKKAAPAKRAAR